jgi:hypothetical protein
MVMIINAILGIIFIAAGCGSNLKESGNSNNNSETDTYKITATDSRTDSPADSITDPNKDSDSVSASASITIKLKEGTANTPKIVYTMWLENSEHTFIQNLFICNKIYNKTLTGTALPYWTINKRPYSDIDGLSGATIHPEFSITRLVEKEATSEFTVYVEIDHSWDRNDWFNDQPALLYAAAINLNSAQKQYSLVPVGWTAAAHNSTTSVPAPPVTTEGKLNKEMKYITHHADGIGFGTADDRTSTKMVQSLIAIIKQ